MRTRTGLNWLSIFSVACLLAALVFTLTELFFYSQLFPTFPPGLKLGGVPVGGLSVESALTRLETAYIVPLELHYQESVILLNPVEVGFELKTNIMLPEASRFRSTENFWSGFWDYLWLQPRQSAEIPLRSDFSPEKLRAYLADLALRYDRPGSAPEADPAALNFKPGTPGHTLNLEATYRLVEVALHAPAPNDRVVVVPVAEQTAVRPSFNTLADLIQLNVQLSQFNGVVSVYVYDLQTGEELSLNLVRGARTPGPIAFSAMSTIKIPIMVAFFAQKDGALSDDEQLILGRSIDASQNTATDQIMTIIGRGDGLGGTRQIVEDLKRLDLHNTYISGLLDVAGAVLAPLATPANTRTDLTTNPDPYNQTTAEEMGLLLTMLQQCAQGGGGFMAAFPGQFTSEECRQMIDLLTDNAVGPIFILGGSLPDGVVAHKHGWDSVPLNNVADAGIVFTPGGNYVLTLYLHSDENMLFDDANRLLIGMAKAVYTYFNP